MAQGQDDYLSGYLFASGLGESFLSEAQGLAETPGSGVHFVFPLVGAWDSLVVLEAAPSDLEAIRRLASELTRPGQSRHHMTAIAVAGRIKKSIAAPVEVIVGLRTRAGVAGPLFDDLQAFSPAGVEVRIDRVNGGYDIAGELSGQDFEAIQEAVEQLRNAVGERASLDVSYGSFP